MRVIGDLPKECKVLVIEGQMRQRWDDDQKSSNLCELVCELM